ncbi:choline dehydrogenase family protein [Aspergillus undulatus]|uniref:choline dehydrogenase family protein n=1 Tax=Aspergillus undulatus TaxID=1810928 RepID=UPI003CCD31F4
MREAWSHPDGIAFIVLREEYFPGPHVQTDAEILEAIVDSKARVFGVSGLRVVNASSFVILPPGRPQSTCYMLAEKIAADIINDANGIS